MSYLDIIIAIPLLWGLYKGFTKGFVIEMAALFSLCLGVYGAIKFSDFVSIYFREQFAWDTPYLPVIAFGLTFICIVLLVYLIAKVIEQFIRLAALGVVNRIFGSLFGVLKFALIISCLFYALESVGVAGKIITEKQQQQSLLYKPVTRIAPTIIPAFKNSNLSSLKIEDLTTMR